jgi:hypothetical protein
MKKLALLALALSACTAVDSDNILTSGMYADLGAQARGDGTTTVTATLYLGSPSNLDFIDLTADDELRASIGDSEKVMSETNILNAVGYDATFQTDAEDDTFVIDFQRSVDQGAPESVVTLPAQFELEPAAQSVPRAQALTLAWAPASDDLMRWNATGECIEPAGATINNDTGTDAITANTFRKREGATVADSCLVTLTMRRSRVGSVDTHFGEGGTAFGEQIRTLTFTSTP